MIYVTSDIHGMYEKLILLVNEINLTTNDTLYILGDLTDRGNDNLKVIEFCKNHPQIKVIKGNHESLFINGVGKNFLNKVDWMQNGGNKTLSEFEKLSYNEKEEILKYLKSLPLYEEVNVNNKDYILVHAGINPKDIEKDLKLHKEKDLLWIREKFHYKDCYKDKIIIFGHTQTRYLNKNKSMKIWYQKDKIGIDCGAISVSYGGKLACLCLDNGKEFYI